MSYQFELALRQYIAAFDGTNSISQEDFQSRFDNLYHKNYTFVPINKTTFQSKGIMTRDEVFELESNRFADGTKMTLIHCRKIGFDCIDIMILMENGNKEAVIRIVTTISSKQAIKSKEITEDGKTMIGASCASAVYKWKEIGTFQTNM